MCFHRATFRAEVGGWHSSSYQREFPFGHILPEIMLCPLALQAMTSTWVQPVPAMANHPGSSIALLTLAVSGDILFACASPSQVRLDGRGINNPYCDALIPTHCKQETTFEKSASKD